MMNHGADVGQHSFDSFKWGFVLSNVTDEHSTGDILTATTAAVGVRRTRLIVVVRQTPYIIP